MAIITATEYKTRRGLTGSDYDTLLADIIPSKQAWLERRCGRAFDEATYTDQVVSGNGESRLYLPNWPVTDLSAVKSVASDGTTTTLSSSSYRLVDERYIYRLTSLDLSWGYRALERGPVWAEGDGNYQITYTAGYTTGGSGTMPEDLKDLMYKLVDLGMEERGQHHLLQQSGDGVIQRVNMNPADQRAWLADAVRPWKAVVV
jgi:hypothetical protein